MAPGDDRIWLTISLPRPSFSGKPIQLFNQGKNLRDYTYIDDIVESMLRIITRSDSLKSTELANQFAAEKSPNYHLFNIGGSQPVPVVDFVETLERILGREAIKEMVEFQAGDVYSTEAETKKLFEFIDYIPETTLEDGLKQFVDWYKSYYQV